MAFRQIGVERAAKDETAERAETVQVEKKEDQKPWAEETGGRKWADMEGRGAQAPRVLRLPQSGWGR